MTAGVMHDSERDHLWGPAARHWIGWIAAFVVVMVATALKDWWLAGDAPNALFYAFVPPFSVAVTSLTFALLAMLFWRRRPYRAMLLIALALATIMQIVEIVLKIVWYKVWEYSGILWFGITFGLYFCASTYALRRWGKLPWWLGLIVSVLAMVADMMCSTVFLELTGLETPGS